jgi:hypothetical protein
MAPRGRDDHTDLDGEIAPAGSGFDHPPAPGKVSLTQARGARSTGGTPGKATLTSRLPDLGPRGRAAAAPAPRAQPGVQLAADAGHQAASADDAASGEPIAVVARAGSARSGRAVVQRKETGAAAGPAGATSDDAPDERVTALIQALLQAGKLEHPLEWVRALRTALAAADADVKAQALQDQRLLRATVWNGRPERLLEIARRLDPVEELRQALERGRDQGLMPAQRLATVRAFAQQRPDVARTALVHAGVMDLIGGFPIVDRIVAVEYLMHGGELSDRPVDRLRRAIEASDNGAVRELLLAHQADLAPLQALTGDAEFFKRCRSRLDPLTYGMVESVLLGEALPSANELADLTEAERLQVEPICQRYCRALAAELQSSVWVRDATVLSHLDGFLAEIATLTEASTDADADNRQVLLGVKREKAKAMLCDMYAQFYDQTLEYAVNRGMSGSELERALAILRIRRIDVPGAAPGLGGFPKQLTGYEHAVVHEKVAVLVPRLRRLLAPGLLQRGGASIEGPLTEYRSWLHLTVSPEDPQQPASVEAATHRRQEAWVILRETYERYYGSTIESDARARRIWKGDGAAGELAGAERFTPERGPETYTGEITDEERPRMQAAARRGAAAVNQALFSWQKRGLFSTAIWRQEDVLSQLELAREDVHEAVAPPSSIPITAEVRQHWDTKTAEGMYQLQLQHDRQFGSLINAIHRYCSGSVQRTCLALIGNRRDPNLALAEEAAGKVVDDSDEGQIAFTDKMQALQADIAKLAEAFYAELSSWLWVSDKKILALANDFVALKQRDEYRDMPQLSDGFGPYTYRTMLVNAYTPLGGSIRHAIQAGLSKGNARVAYDRLDLHSGAEGDLETDQAIDDQRSRATAGGDVERQLMARGQLKEPCKKVFSMLRRYQKGRETQRAAMGSHGAGAPPPAVEVWLFFDLREVAKSSGLPQDGVPLMMEVYRDENGIDLVQHCGLVLPSYELASVQRALNLASPIPQLQPVTNEEASGKEIVTGEDDAGPGGTGPLGWDAGRVGTDFTLEIAREHAIALHQSLSEGNLAKTRRLLAGRSAEGAFKEEHRVVLEVFRRLYGYDIRYKIKEAVGDDDVRVDTLDALARSAGQMDFVAEIRLYVDGRDRNKLFSTVLTASEEDKQALLRDHKLLYDIHERWDQETLDRVYRSCTGELTVGDMLRTRDKGRWYTFYIGTDEEGVYEDLEVFFGHVRTTLEAQERHAQSQGGTFDVDAAFRAKCRQVFRDPDVREMIDAEFSGDEKLKVEQLILRGGDRTATDKVHEDTTGWWTSKSIHDHLSQMTDAEREASRQDPSFLAKLSSSLHGRDLQRALEILHADRGKETDAAFTEAIGFTTDRDKIFETLRGMDADQMHALVQDPLLIARIRSHLRESREGEQPLFDDMVAAMEGLGASQHTDPSGPMPRAEKQRQRQALVIKHAFALRRACTIGEKDLIGAAQDCFNEKGEVQTDPSAPGDAEQLFRARDRLQVWEQVKGPLYDRFGQEKILYDPYLGPTSIPPDRDFLEAIELAVLGERDPARYRFDRGVAGKDDKDEIRAALRGVGDDMLIKEWSNILPSKQEGHQWPSMKEAYENFKAAPDDLEAQKKFYRFAVDVNPAFASVLAQDHKMRAFTTTQKELVEYKGIVRERLQKVSHTAIGAAIGATEEHIELLDTLTFTRTALLLSQQAATVYQQQFGGRGSAIDGFTNKDDAAQNAFLLYRGALGQALESDEEGQAGTVSKEESEGELKDRLDYFNVKIEEYKAAKQAVASALRWIAIAIIGAVTTALTGPGGPTLMAALITAAAQAGATVVINEAVLGNDYDLVQEGLRQILVDTAVGGLSFGVGHMLKNANSEVLRGIRGFQNKVTAFEKQLEQGATKTLPGFFGHIGYQTGKAGLMTGGRQIRDAAVDSLDPAIWKYGPMQGFSEMRRNISAAIQAAPEKMKKAMIQTLIAKSATVGREKLFGDGEDSPDLLPGATIPEAEEDLQDPTILAALRAGFSGATSGDELRDALWDQSFELLGDKVVSGDLGRSSGWSGEDMASFMADFVKGRVSEGIKGAGKSYQERRNAVEAQKRLASFATSIDLPPAEKSAALRHYRHHLEKNASYAGDGLGPSPEEWLASEWKPLQAQIAARASERGDGAGDADAYTAWVLADPSESRKRLAVSYQDFERRHARAQERVARIQSSRQYRELSDEQQGFLDVVLTEPSRVHDLVTDRPDTTWDIRDSAGMDNFRASYAATKQALVLAEARTHTEEWEPLKAAAFKARVEAAAPEKLPELHPLGGNAGPVGEYVRQFSAEYAQTMALSAKE